MKDFTANSSNGIWFYDIVFYKFSEHAELWDPVYIREFGNPNLIRQTRFKEFLYDNGLNGKSTVGVASNDLV